jgi:hypothetical protein
MINGAHAIFYSDDADATWVTLAKVLGTRSVDAGGGWLIFALPPAEIAVHPADEGRRAELYLMTDDVTATVAALQAEGIEVARPISDQGWGLLTAITLPGGVELGLYQPGTRPRPNRPELDALHQARSHRSPRALVAGGWSCPASVDTMAMRQVLVMGAGVRSRRACGSPGSSGDAGGCRRPR